MKNFQRILNAMHRAIEKYNLIENGDKIAVGISGGKDSLCLFKALCVYQKYSKLQFEIFPVVVDLFDGKYEFSKLKTFCKEFDKELTVTKSQIFDVVFNQRKESNPCSLCAKMRRGILNATAKELGCNKVALGHHADDLVQTFFLSLIYESRLSTFLPKTYLSETQIDVIRPFVFVDEQQIINEEKDLPVFKNPCPADHNTKREEMKKIIENLNEKYNCKKNIFNAIIENERYNLFDKINKNN